MKDKGCRARIVVGVILLVSLIVAATNCYAMLNKPAMTRAASLPAPRTQYIISVSIAPDTYSYHGHERVVFHNRQKSATGYLVFFSYPNDPSISRSNKKHMVLSGVRSGTTELTTEENGPAVKVFLPQPLESGRSVAVEFDFDGTLPRQVAKDMFSQTMDQLTSIINPSAQSQQDYGVFSSSKDILNLGMWYSALSKYDSDGWDQEKYSGVGDVSYFDPADFRVNVTVPASCQVVTTGSLLKQQVLKDSRMTYQFESTMTRDFAIQLSPRYAMKTGIVGGTVVKSYFLKEHEESGAFVAETAVKAFDYYQKLIGPYPYTELDVVEAPLYGGAGGVEFPGLVTISSMLYRDPDASNQDVFQQLLSNSPVFDQLIEFVVAHEVAHQWWNAVVGSNSKRHPFVDEAMANYTAVLYFEKYHGREAAEKQMSMQMKINYQLLRMMGGADGTVDRPASEFQNPLAYSGIVYGKGALYLDHLRELMGDGPFYKALKDYYNSYWFKIAGPHDFTAIAAHDLPAKKDEIDKLYNRWIEETHGDEDIGQGTLDAVLKTVMPEGSSVASDQMEELLKQLQGMNPDQMQDLLKDLEGILKEQQEHQEN